MPMKKRRRKGDGAARVAEDELLPEYDFTRARRSPYAAALARDTVVVELEPDVAKLFPDAAAVNQALRALGRIAKRAASIPSPRKRER